MNKLKLSLLGCLLGMGAPMAYAASAGQAMVNPQSGVVVGYWHNWCGGAGYQGGTAPCVKLDQVNPQYNVVDVSFMKVYGSDPIPTFKLDPATGMSRCPRGWPRPPARGRCADGCPAARPPT